MEYEDLLIRIAMFLYIAFLLAAILAISWATVSGIKGRRADNNLQYTNQRGTITTIPIPNDAYYEGYTWDENHLIITFSEG